MGAKVAGSWGHTHSPAALTPAPRQRHASTRVLTSSPLLVEYSWEDVCLDPDLYCGDVNANEDTDESPTFICTPVPQVSLGQPGGACRGRGPPLSPPSAAPFANRV